jgi:hypothetical protein
MPSVEQIHKAIHMAARAKGEGCNGDWVLSKACRVAGAQEIN